MGLGRLLVRGAIGSLMVGHGTQKLFGWFGGGGPEGTGQFFEQVGLRPGRRNALAAGAAEAGGVLPGDKIVSVGGERIGRFGDLQRIVRGSAGGPRACVVVRDGADVSLTVTPRLHEEKDNFGNVHQIGFLGVGGRARPDEVPGALPGPFAGQARSRSGGGRPRPGRGPLEQEGTTAGQLPGRPGRSGSPACGNRGQELKFAIAGAQPTPWIHTFWMPAMSGA